MDNLSNIFIILQFIFIIIVDILLVWILVNNNKIIRWQYYQFYSHRYKDELSKLELNVKKRKTSISLLILFILTNLTLLPSLSLKLFKTIDIVSNVSLSKSIIEDYYESDPSTLIEVYNKYSNKIKPEISYKLDTEFLSNLIYRHKNYTSSTTDVNFENIISNNEYVYLEYTIKVPITEAEIKRASIFKFEDNIIVDYIEYDLEYTVKYDN